MKKIWCVFNPNGRAPSHVHDSKGSAINEAKRLAQINPGHKFYVMEGVGCAEKVDIAYHDFTRADFNEEELPF